MIDRDTVHKIFDQGFQQFHFVIERFSRFDVKSELSKLNNSHGKETKVSKELFKLIKYAQEIANKTGGAFDPTIIDILETYGYDEDFNFERLENRDLVQREIKKIIKERGSFKDIRLNQNRSSITLVNRLRIDLGSIGKGYAIDRAYKKMKPLKNFLINAGGDIRASGISKDKKPWLIGLKVPQMGQIGTIRLDNKSVCCSGSWARKVKFFHHLINPKTGNPQNDLKTVFILADTAIEADAWSTALFVAGKDAEKYITRYKLKAILVTKKNEVQNFNLILQT